MKMPLGFSLVPLLSLPCSQGLDSLNRVSSVFIRHNEQPWQICYVELKRRDRKTILNNLRYFSVYQSFHFCNACRVSKQILANPLFFLGSEKGVS